MNHVKPMVDLEELFMAKKLVFLLVLLFALLLTTVTALAAGTDSATPGTGFTEDKSDKAEAKPEIKVVDLEAEYGEIFFGDVTSSREIISLVTDEKGDVGKRVYPNNLRYLFEAMALEIDPSNPVVMLMYIKVDDKYVPLIDVDTGSNMTQEVYYLDTTVDLKYLKSTNKVNEIRIIAFRKNDAGKLALDENLQIIDITKTVRPWNIFEKAGILLWELFN